VRADLIVLIGIALQRMAQEALAKHDAMIKAVPAD
jgi:hypothetical protein